MKLKTFAKEHKAVFYGAIALIVVAALVIALLLIKSCNGPERGAEAFLTHTGEPNASSSADGADEPTALPALSCPPDATDAPYETPSSTEQGADASDSPDASYPPGATYPPDASYPPGATYPPVTPEPYVPDPTSVTQVFGMVAGAKNVSYGVSTAGLVSYTGRTNGRAECYDWRNIVQLDASEKLTVAVDSSGKVFVAGSQPIKRTASGWKNVKSVCATNTAVYALTADGKVIGSDGKTYTGAAFIASTDRDLFVYGKNSVIHAPSGAVSASGGVLALGVSGTHSVILDNSLTLRSSRSGDPFNGVKAARVFAGDGCTAYIDGGGNLRTDCAHIIKAIEAGSVKNASVGYTGGAKTAFIRSAAYFCCRGGHALVLLADGGVIGCGDNAYLQNDVSSWRLRPYSSGGYVYGIAPGKGVKTGQQYTAPNGASGTAVVLGDIDMDGNITRAYHNLIMNYIAGKANLTSAQKQAANIIRDAKKPDAVDHADAEQLDYHIKGYTVIDQYLKRFTYSGEVADAERKNKDVCGYIRLKNTNIDAPIMYGKDFYYHYHSWTGASSSNGAIYLYYGYPSKNTVITGHNLRKSGTMLHDLHKIQDRYAKSYSTYSNRLWTINLFGETHLYEVFSMYEEKPPSFDKSSLYYNCNYAHTMEKMSESGISSWIDYQQARTQLNYKIEVSTSDRFLTVVTCADLHSESNLGGRIYFFLRMVDGH